MTTGSGFKTVLVAVAAAALLGCAGESDTQIQSEELKGADDSTATIEGELSSAVPIGTTLEATTGVNLRTGPGTGYRVLHIVPAGARVKTVERTAPSEGFYKVNHGGTVGWSHGTYYKVVAYPAAPDTTTARDAAINRARTGVGFSYWWGHGRWLPSGSTSSVKGYCSGSCPNCSHSGSYGADCSGYVAKVWQVPSTNTTLSTDSHPYSTWNFDNESTSWHAVSRSAIRRGDAMVYNADGAGHMFIFESGDPWGNMWTYEARGCSYGIVRNIRTAFTSYKSIARNGY